MKFNKIATSLLTSGMLVGMMGAGMTVSAHSVARHAAANKSVTAVVSEAQLGPCTVSDSYARGSSVVFRIQLLAANGQQLVNTSKTQVSIKVPGAKPLVAQYATHEGGKQKFWVAHWTISKNYPTGQVNYAVLVKVNGKAQHVNRVSYDVTDSQAHLNVTK